MAARRRWLRRLGLAGLGLGGLLGASLVGTVVFLETPWGQAWLAGQVEGLVSGLMREGGLTIGRLRSDLLTYVVLQDVALHDGAGRPLIVAEGADLRLRPWDLLGGTVHITSLDLTGVDVDLLTRDDGTLDIAWLFGSDEPVDPAAPPWSGLPVDIVAEALRVQADHVGVGGPTGLQMTGVDLSARLDARGKRFAVGGLELRGEAAAPVVGPLAVLGDVVWDDTSLASAELDVRALTSRLTVAGSALDLGGEAEAVDLTLGVKRLDLADIDQLAHSGLAGVFAGELTAKGPLSAMVVEGDLAGQEGTEGTARVGVTVDALRPGWDGRVALTTVRLDHVLPVIGQPFPVSADLGVQGYVDGAWPDGVHASGRLDDGALQIMGLDVQHVGTTLALDQGVLRLSEATLSGPMGAAQGGGLLDLTSGRLALDLDVQDIDTSALRGVSVPAELDGSRADGTAHFTMDLYAPDVSLAVEGELDAAPIRYGPDVYVERAKGSYRVAVRGTDVDVDGDVTGYNVLAYGSTFDQARVPGLVVQVRERGTHIEGPLDAQGVHYALIPPDLQSVLGEGVVVDTATGSWRVDVPFAEGADMVVHTELTVGPHRVLRYPGETGTVTFDLIGDAAQAVVQLDAGPTRRLVDADVRFDLSTSAFDLPVLQVAPTRGQTWSAVGDTHFVVDGLGVRELALDLRSARGRIAASGIVGLEGSQHLDLDVYDLDLSALGELVPPWLDGLEGYAGGVVHLDGTSQEPLLDGAFEASDVAWYSPDASGEPVAVVRGLGLHGTLGGGGGSVRLVSRVEADGSPLADVDVSAPVVLAFDRAGLEPGGRLTGEVVLLPGGLERIAALSPQAEGLPDGQVSGRLRVRGTPLRPELKLSLLSQILVPDLPEPLRLEVQAARKAEDVSWQIDVREGLGLLGSVRGGGDTDVDRILDWVLAGAAEPDWTRADLYLAGLRGGLALYGVPVGRLTAATGVELDVAGSLRGEVFLVGDVFAPRPAGWLALRDGRVGTVDVEEASLRLDGNDEGFGLELSTALKVRGQDELHELHLEGLVPLVIDLNQDVAAWERGPLRLLVDSGSSVPLALISAYDPGVVDATGALEIDGRVEGTVWSPEPLLDLGLSDGSRLTYLPLGVRWEDLELDATLSQEAVQLHHFQARTAPVELRLERLGSDLLNVVGQGLKRGGRLFQGRKARARVAKADRGSVQADGTALLDAWAVTDLALEASLDRVLLVDTDDQTVRMSTDSKRPLTVSGDVSFPRISGGVRVDEADVFLDYATAIGGGETELDNRVAVHRTGQIGRVVEEEPASVLDNVAIDVAVDLGRAARGRLTMPLESIAFLGSAASSLTKIDLRARLAGDVRYRQLPCQRLDDDGVAVDVPGRAGACGLYHPQMEGNIEIVDGTARVFRADFTLTDSFVRFLGGEVYNPNLDIHGAMDTGDTTIDMAITGTAYDPKVDFTSAGTDQVFATLILGQSPDSLSGQDADRLAFTMAMTAFQSVLSGANIGTFSLRPNGQIGWGVAISRDLFVEGTVGGTPRPDENTIEVEVEYTFFDGLLGKVGFGAYATPFWGDILFERKFD